MPLTLQFLAACLLVAATLRGMRRYARERTPERETKVGGVLSLFAYFSVLGAILLGLVGLWRMHVMNGIEARWTPQAVTVVRCQVIHHDSPPGVDGYNYYGAACLFRSAGGEAAEWNWEACCVTEPAVRRWLLGYDAGTRHRLYRDPGGGRLSLGWAEGPIAYQSPHRSAREMLLFAIVGWLTWFGARWLERFGQPP